MGQARGVSRCGCVYFSKTINPRCARYLRVAWRCLIFLLGKDKRDPKPRLLALNHRNATRGRSYGRSITVSVSASRDLTTKLASHPTANVVIDPINTYHCHEIGVRNLTYSMTAAPITMPMIAGADCTRFVKVPRKKIPSITPLVND